MRDTIPAQMPVRFDCSKCETIGGVSERLSEEEDDRGAEWWCVCGCVRTKSESHGGHGAETKVGVESGSGMGGDNEQPNKQNKRTNEPVSERASERMGVSRERARRVVRTHTTSNSKQQKKQNSVERGANNNADDSQPNRQTQRSNTQKWGETSDGHTHRAFAEDTDPALQK
jgi:hypothetical protein